MNAIFRARCLLPVAAPALDNGAFVVAGDRIAEVGPWNLLKRSATGPVVDLGDAIVFPGLINAHCHLDYTGFAGAVPRIRFPDWIKGLLACKAGWSFTEFAESWIRGARMLVRNGVTSVADIEAVPELLPDAWQSTPLRVFSFLEMTGVKSGRPDAEILQEALVRLETLPPARGRPGLSPHAPYSTRPELLRLTAAAARGHGWRLAMHVAESQDEFDMFFHRRGPLFDWLQGQREMSDCGGVTPVHHLERCGLLSESLLAVHANCVDAPDAERLARRRVSVVHCPQSRRFFDHPTFPLDTMRSAGVNVCLGTDSLASVEGAGGAAMELDLRKEMRLFLDQAACSPEEVLAMATVNGAKALGRSGIIGALSPGSQADWAAVRYEGALEDAAAAVIGSDGSVLASMIDGIWAMPPENAVDSERKEWA